MLHKLRSFWRAATGRRAFEDAMREEMRFHLESRAADLVRRGLPPAEAARRARLEFGPIEKHKDAARESLGLRLVDETAGDARYALRTFVRNKGFTATVVLTLALGIGANTAIFSLIDALMLRWLPVSNPQELLQLTLQAPGDKSAGESFSYAIVRALDEHTEMFAGVAGFSASAFAVGAPGSMSRVPGAIVTGRYYQTLGVNPAAGRLLGRDDDQPGAPAAAVLSYGYWERQFARNPQAIGQTLVMNGVPVTIAGVSAPGFVGADVGQVADITIAAAALPTVIPSAAPLLGKGNFWLGVLARPTPGASLAETTSRLAAVWRHTADTVIAPHWPPARRKAMADAIFVLVPGGTGRTYLREMYVKPLQVLMAAVALVLLIACANIASLLLARASVRQREIAVRLAIGAGRGRIIRQLLLESTLLSLTGAACGIGLAWISGRFVLDMISTGPARVVFDLTPNWHVLAFTSAVAVLTGVLLGIAPALQSTAPGPAPALKDDARTNTGRSRLLPSLIAVQVALSLVLLIGAGLFARTLQNLRNLNPGFNPEGVLLVELDGRGPALSAALLDEIRRVPGVAAASVSTHTPLSGALWSEPAVPAGQPLPERDTALFVGAGPRFFDTMQIRLLSGRELTERDAADSPAVAVVNERFAQRYFPNQNPVGQHLSTKINSTRRDLEIVGLANNTNAASLRAAPPATVYVSYAQLTGDISTTLEVRSAGAFARVASAIRQQLQPAFPNAPIEVRPLSAQVQATMVQERMMATLAGGFGVLALILASVGVYGLLAYSVARRTREIGIRMALGAERRGVIALVLRSARWPLTAGVVIGLPVAWASSRGIQSLLFGLKPTDPVAIGTATLVLVAVAHLAAYLPARRAARVDPLVALKCE